VVWEENAINHPLVLIGDGSILFPHDEDHVKVLAVEKFGLAVLDPLGTGQRLTLGAVTIAAGSIANATVAAGSALFDLTSESGSGTPRWLS
jgi:hypothetical protein